MRCEELSSKRKVVVYKNEKQDLREIKFDGHCTTRQTLVARKWKLSIVGISKVKWLVWKGTRKLMHANAIDSDKEAHIINVIIFQER